MKLIPQKDLPTKEQIIATPTKDLIKLFKIFVDMAILCTKEDGIGLSAVQIGVPWKFFIIRAHKNLGKFDRYGKDKVSCFINTEYEPVEDEKFTSLEGCLSIRHTNGGLRYYEVDRYKKVRIIGHEFIARGGAASADPRLEILPYDKIVEGQLGIVFQHEIDHQRSILISDIGKEVFLY